MDNFYEENRIRAYRKACHMTLQQLADIVGSTKSYMWQLEQKADPQPGVGLAYRIAEAFGAPISAVFNVEQAKNETR